MENNTYKNDEIEIDLLELFGEFKRKLWMILVSILVFGTAAGLISFFVLTPQYSSTAMVYILSKETTLTSLADLQIGSQLTKDYKIIVTSRPVLEDVIEKLELDVSYKDLIKKVTIDNPADTRILSITVEDPDPMQAKTIADKIADTASDYIGDIMEMIPPKMIEDGEIPEEQSSPHNLRNLILGAILGLVLACGLISLQVILNDTVQTEEDVARYLGLSVLASVPLREGEIPEEKDSPTYLNRKSKKKKSTPSGKSRKKKRGVMRP